MKTLKILFLLFLTAQFTIAQDNHFSHDSWNHFLKKYVTETGNVNYKGIKANVSELNSYLELLKANKPSANWSTNEAKAYWINAYNAFTVKLIVDNYPVKSIKDLGSPWDKRFIKIGSENYTLNEIEHKILLPNYKDERIHFAIVCAAKSCPILSNKAYTANELDTQLSQAIKRFLTDTSRNKIAADKVQISELFNWYKADFTKKRLLVDFLNQYSTIKINSKAKVSFMTYNWSLNE